MESLKIGIFNNHQLQSHINLQPEDYGYSEIRYLGSLIKSETDGTLYVVSQLSGGVAEPKKFLITIIQSGSIANEHIIEVPNIFNADHYSLQSIDLYEIGSKVEIGGTLLISNQSGGPLMLNILYQKDQKQFMYQLQDRMKLVMDQRQILLLLFRKVLIWLLMGILCLFIQVHMTL